MGVENVVSGNSAGIQRLKLSMLSIKQMLRSQHINHLVLF